MKKLFPICLALLSLTLYSFESKAQAQTYLNIGGIGTGVYAGYEIPVSSDISVQPFASTDWELDKLIFGAKGNFYLDDLLELSEEWDVYGGANFGWRIDKGNDDGANWGLQVGGRWFWSEKWGINAEFGGGSSVLGGIGVTMKM